MKYNYNLKIEMKLTTDIQIESLDRDKIMDALWEAIKSRGISIGSTSYSVKEVT